MFTNLLLFLMNYIHYRGMTVNESEFERALTKKGMSVRGLAAAIGMPEVILSAKIQGNTEFMTSEIQAIAQTLGLNLKQVNEIFFDKYVNYIH